MAINPQHSRKDIPTLVKNPDLVQAKRTQLVDAAVRLFISKGFHQTTTREIAKAAGFSIGTLYEYIESKEDVLYLVCDSIHEEMQSRLGEAIETRHSARETLQESIAAYFRVCDRMQDSILLIYRETASLIPESQSYVLKNEERITEIFESIIRTGVESGVFISRDDNAIRLMAHNIVVLGHMWAFRRWFLHDAFTIDEFITQQTSLIMGEMTKE